MIDVKCRTNIDKYKTHTWPTAFVCRPELGDSVQSKQGMKLVIVQLTHNMNDNTPLLEVELHLHPSQRLSDHQ